MKLCGIIHFCTQMHIFRGLYVIGVKSCSTQRCALFIHCLFFQQLRDIVFFPYPRRSICIWKQFLCGAGHIQAALTNQISKIISLQIKSMVDCDQKKASLQLEMAQTYMKGAGGDCRKLSVIKGNLHSMQRSGERSLEQLSNLR